ncbi:MAG TPA: pinensin family lanthipeptide [Candidatus Kapabacteria bacterium]|nr:pinensin family lanthipeptide [Candidatus Kapabacteria bacterium]
MPKKLRLDLNNLKVSSFVTSLGNDQRKVRGGVEWTDFATCSCDGGCPLTTVLETCLSCEITCGNSCEACSNPVPCTFNTDCTMDPRICKTAAC